MLVAFSVLAVSVSFLVYRNPPSTWLDFITRLWRFAAPVLSKQDKQAEKSQSEEQAQVNKQIQTELTSSLSPQSTPKAIPHDDKTTLAVPTFTLNEHENDASEDDDDDEEDSLPPPSFPALNSAQRASGPAPSLSMPPPTKPNLMLPPSKAATPSTTASLMPPPRVAPSNLRALPNTSQTMRVPTTGPLPNRGPVPNRTPQSSNGSLGLPPTANPTLKTPNARGKVLLSPGHSPLDWASLQRSGKNLSGVDSLVRVTPAMLKEKNGRKGKPAWSSYQGKVYNISPYLPFHPGGEGELRRAAGKDGTKLFMEVHPWVNWENMLRECVVGILVSEEQVAVAKDVGAASLEDMD